MSDERVIPGIPHRPDKLLSEMPARSEPIVQAPAARNPDGSERSARDQIIDVIKTIFDPEIPVNIYELGLIYDVTVENDYAHVAMTLTSPAWTVARSQTGAQETKWGAGPRHNTATRA
ncbi:MAG: iron-sulfur cluster assembly protein, partial [Myxococcota bacterium]